MLKEGEPTEGDIDWIFREISSNPDEKKKLFELLRVNDDDPGYNSGDSIDNAKDFTDGMTIPRHLLKNQTYGKLAALLGESPLNRRDLAVKTCCIQKGECNTRLFSPVYAARLVSHCKSSVNDSLTKAML